MRALGVHCTSSRAFLAVAEDGEVVEDRDHEQLELAAGFEASERLGTLLADAERIITEVAPDVIRILMPEQTYEDSYQRLGPRVALETVVRLAAVRREVDLEMLHRATARSRLDIDRKGPFNQHADALLPDAVGRYWKGKRQLAAVAALAEEY